MLLETTVWAGIAVLLLQAQTADPCTRNGKVVGSIPMDPWTDNWWIKVSGCKFHKLKSELKGIEKCSINAMSLRYAGKFKIIILIIGFK